MGVDPGGAVKSRLLAAALLAFTVACASGGEPDIATLASNSDQVIWEAGQKAFQKKQWDNARQHFRRIIDGFPASEYGPPARLALGDTYYQEGGTGNYIMAVGAYREFLTLYPSHPRSDYAQFQAAEAFYRQRNGPDRDQTPTLKALDEYQRLVDVYSSSSHAEAARERILELRQSLARSEFSAGYFYQRTRQAHRAAIARYEGILSEYPDYKRLDDVLFRLAEALDQGGRPAEAQPHLARLLAEYPDSEHAAEARLLMAALATRTVAPPAPSPSPTPTPQPPETSSQTPDSAGRR
jgi:outer membrane protein assembly factor BamD